MAGYDLKGWTMHYIVVASAMFKEHCFLQNRPQMGFRFWEDNSPNSRLKLQDLFVHPYGLLFGRRLTCWIAYFRVIAASLHHFTAHVSSFPMSIGVSYDAVAVPLMPLFPRTLGADVSQDA
jgi:hypothetical protein